MSRTYAKQVGALWRHESKNVGQFLTGTLDLGGLGEVPIAVFKNDRKEEGSKQPDFRIVLSEKLAGETLSESQPDAADSGNNASANAERHEPAKQRPPRSGREPRGGPR